MKKIAVVLSGCGVFDGAEITEAILTLLHISKAGASYQCFAPDIEQMHTINHITGEEMQPNRNVLVEAARIARGDIKPLSQLKAQDHDGLVVVGGFGAAKNLSDFAVNGANATMNEPMLKACQSFANAAKPAGYMCIAPAMLPLVYGQGVKTTIGNDTETAQAIIQLGGEHINCSVDNIVVDTTFNVASTPAYMLAQNITEADAGIEKLVAFVVNGE